jgi:DNA-binding CsgD family transcriptional regulator
MTDQATVVLDMVSEAIGAMGRSGADDVVCRHLAREWGLSFAAVLHISPRRTPMTAALWPDDTAEPLRSHLTGQAEKLVAEADASCRVGQWERPAGGNLQILYAVVRRPAAPDAAAGPGRARVAAFARSRPYTSDDVDLWAVAAEPLGALWGQADRWGASASRDHRPVSTDSSGGEVSERELEVLDLLAEGRLATSIASELSVSPRTVHKHLANIYKKLGVHDRLLAVKTAQQRGLIPSPGADSA